MRSHIPLLMSKQPRGAHPVQGRGPLASWVHVDNKGKGVGFGVGLAPKTAGGSRRGVDLGIRYSF